MPVSWGCFYALIGDMQVGASGKRCKILRRNGYDRAGLAVKCFGDLGAYGQIYIGFNQDYSGRASAQADGFGEAA
jgi:hypothetical protein